ncbi:hypothetical protein KY290_023813 [Solanum tuberosum]|uniref:Uncharacterized protein n=2 Tax=Solanum tuberosum TaxID=4113 RepID=A0ABQ7UNZ4_SOLTU|nr:hypothetical protein KY290_023813 [Solanum tuberosum]
MQKKKMNAAPAEAIVAASAPVAVIVVFFYFFFFFSFTSDVYSYRKSKTMRRDPEINPPHNEVNWLLTYVIAVLESKFGFEALRRSANLLKGKRWIASNAMLSYGLLMGLLVVTHSIISVMVGVAQGSLMAIMVVVVGSLMMNHYLLGNVALYMYCKDEFFNGEKSPLEIGHKFTGASEYVSMPMDDEKNHAIVIHLLLLVPPPLLLVNWSLAYVIAVVESKSGFETLRRSSAYLVKEKRSVGFRIHLNFVLMVGGMVIGSNVFIANTMLYGLVKSGWWSIPMVMGTMMWWILASSGMRELLMKNVLLYMYCNDFNGGKLTLEEIGGKFGDEFVYLPLDDEKNHGIV